LGWAYDNGEEGRFRGVGKWKFGGRDPKNIRTIVILYDIGKR